MENESVSGQSHRRRGTTFKCESCAKVYRHPSCLVKHRWEHSPHWHEASKFLLSKHQQVQLLEAAAILSHLSPATAGGTSLPEDRSLWPSYLSGGLLPLPPGHSNSFPHITGLVAPNSNFDPATAFVEVDSSSGDRSAHVHPRTASGVKIEASPEVDVLAKSEDSTSEEEEEDDDNDHDHDVEIEDIEFDADINVDIDVDVEGDDYPSQENKTRDGAVTSSLPSSSRRTVDFDETYSTAAIATTRTRTTTPGLSMASSKSSTPKPLPTPGTATIPARAGLTEIRPGLLGHPNPPPSCPPSSTLPTHSLSQSMVQSANDQTQRVGASPTALSPWPYGYSHPHVGSNGYAIISQSSVPSSSPSILHQHPSHISPFSMSAPLSVPPFSQHSHAHGHNINASYSPSPHHYTFSPSYSPVGSIAGPFASLSLSSLPYSSSNLEDSKQVKGLGLPRSSVRSSSGSLEDDDEMDKDGDAHGIADGGVDITAAEEDGKDTGRRAHTDQALVSTNTPGNGGEWEMEI